jgi:uncharacterized protein (TIGR01244 family)
MRVLEVAPEVYASGQLFETDLQLLSKQNVRSIVNTQPDSDSTGLAKTAEEFGITYVYFPVEPKAITDEVAAEFAKTCEELKRPLLICSGSGAHSVRIWETSE